MEKIIEINHLRKEFSNITPLKDVNTSIYKGDVISIIGPSGTGKSTFLRCINKLENATSGEIIIDGENILAKGTKITKIRQKMGMVFQSFNLFSHKTILENVMMGQIDLLHKSKQEAHDKALELLEMVGLKDKAFNLPEELSGGQKQRAAIARTLSMEPEIILFDEPTSALDPTMVGEVLTVIKELANRGLTMLIVTHEMNFARNVSNRIFFMDEGIIYEDGTPEQIFEHPQKEKTRQFIQKLKTCEITFNKDSFNYSDMNVLVSDFGRKNMLNSIKLYDVQLIVDEICVNCLLPLVKGDINFFIEYSQETQHCLINLRYSGEKIDLYANLDEIQVKFIKGATTSIKESSCEDGSNLISIELL